MVHSCKLFRLSARHGVKGIRRLYSANACASAESGLRPSQCLREAMDQLRVQHRDLDAIRPIKRHSQVQRVDAGRFQRYSHPRLALMQPGDQGLVPGCFVVVENTLLEPLIFLMNGCGKNRGTHIDVAKYGGTAWMDSACSQKLLEGAICLGYRPLSASTGLLFAPPLNIHRL